MQRHARLLGVSTLALGVVVIVSWWLSTRSTSPRETLVAAVGSTLPFEARLTGGFLPPTGTVRRAGFPAEPPALSPDALIATALIEKRAAANPDAGALADLGVAHLIRGEVDRSLSVLSDAAAQAKLAAPWSDLSAAHLVKASRVPERRIEHLAHALDAAAASLRIAPSHEARYNRALALQGLAAFVGDPAPWDEYLAIETESAWREAARRWMTLAPPVADSREEWTRRLNELRKRLADRDRAYLEETARLFPEASLEFFEQEVLPAWARAVLNREDTTIGEAVASATLMAEAIHGATADRVPLDAVAATRTRLPALAAAHLAYSEGVKLFDTNVYADATKAFERARAGFDRARSPYAVWTRVQLAALRIQVRTLEGVDQELEQLQGIARTRSYPTLLGRTLWLHGLSLSKEWRFTEALAAFRDGTAAFEGANEHEYAVSLYHHLADTLRTLGDDQLSWEYIGRTLEGLSRVRKPVRRYLSLYNASLFARSRDLHETALLFQNATVREASRAAIEVEAEALAQRAAIHLQRGDRARAAADIGAAAERVSRLSEGFLKVGLTSELVVLRAQLEPAWAAPEDVGRAIAFYERTEPSRLPGVFLSLARSARAANRTTDAESALTRGIARLEAQQSSLDDDAMRISYFDESWDLFPEMVDLQLDIHRLPDRAFEYADRSKARTLMASMSRAGRPVAVQRLADIQALLPPTVALIVYAALADRLLIWSVTTDSAALTEQRVPADTLTRQVSRLRQAILDRRESGDVNRTLFETLIRPAMAAIAGKTTAVFVPDGALHLLPFAALRDPATGRYLVEARAIASTPSASFFATAMANARERTSIGLTSALLVGNPATRTEAGLPGADLEVSAAATIYQRHQVLQGERATKAAFIAAAPTVDVIHFGGHALVNAEYPMLSRLLFSANQTGTAEPLFARDVTQLHLPRTQLVILAACSTAVGSIARGEGAISVARPFLGLGVPLVVASQWDVDDVATARLFGAFHRELAAVRDPVKALRAAQLAMIAAGGDSALPVNWAAFVAMGTTTH